MEPKYKIGEIVYYRHLDYSSDPKLVVDRVCCIRKYTDEIEYDLSMQGKNRPYSENRLFSTPEEAANHYREELLSHFYTKK